MRNCRGQNCLADAELISSRDEKRERLRRAALNRVHAVKLFPVSLQAFPWRRSRSARLD